MIELLGLVRDLAWQVAVRDAERLVHRLDSFTDQQRVAPQHLRSLIWCFYADRKTYRADPSPRCRSELRALRSYLPTTDRVRRA